MDRIGSAAREFVYPVGRVVAGYLSDQDFKFAEGKMDPAQVCDYAAKTNNIGLLQWARVQDPPLPWNESACDAAIEHDNLDILKWLMDPNTGGGACPARYCCEKIAKFGSIRLMEWARSPEQGPVPWGAACSYAAECGRIHMLEWLRDPSTGGGICPWSLASHPCIDAAYSGQLDALKWLRDPNTGGGMCPWEADECMRYAAAGGHPNIIAWIQTTR